MNKPRKLSKERIAMRGLKCLVCGKRACGIINRKAYCKKHFIRNRKRGNIYYGK